MNRRTMRFIIAAILLATAGGVSASSILSSREEQPIRTHTYHHQLRTRSINNIQQQQQQPSLPTLQQRNLQSNNDDGISTIEFCGKCTWSANISCEARAQFLVKEGRFETLQDARVSILQSCKPDGSDRAKIPLGKLYI